MLGIPLRYLLRHPVVAVVNLAADPFEIWTTIHDSYVAQGERRRSQCSDLFRSSILICEAEPGVTTALAPTIAPAPMVVEPQ
jgi:hypothetical protein